MSWKGFCAKCGKSRRSGVGLFCGNFLLGRGTFPRCEIVYCGKCYTAGADDPFPRQQGLDRDLEDKEDEMDVESEEQSRFLRARDGDHLLVPFECDLCHFRNCCLRDPILDSERDINTLRAIRRANLDAFWSRETSTVRENLSRMRRDCMETETTTSIVGLLPEMGNPLLVDRVGMKIAIATLVASLREGRNTANVQWDTVRKTPTWIRHLHESGRHYRSNAYMGGATRKATLSDSPTVGDWFGCFAKGCRARMGVVRVQNEPLTSPIFLALDTIATEEWKAATTESTRESIEDVMCYVTFGFCNGLRGEEVPLVSLKGLLHFWDETARADQPFVMTTLYGKFKGEMDCRWHCLPIPDVTRSGIPARKWIGQGLYRRVSIHDRSHGPFFLRPNGKRGRISDYNEEFRRLIGRVKDRYPKLILADADPELFSLWRSMRRGATLETTGRVSDETIRLYHRWRSVENSKAGAPAGLSMHQVYIYNRNL